MQTFNTEQQENIVMLTSGNVSQILVRTAEDVTIPNRKIITNVNVELLFSDITVNKVY